MTLRPMTFAAALIAPTLLTAAPAEQTVTLSNNGQQIVGTLATPTGGPAPVVLMLHGFSGARDELAIPSVEEGVFARSARTLAEAGFASLRIDFRGSGDSTADLTFQDTTFEGQIADALAAIAYLKGSDAVDGDHIHLLGWSQGGLVAAATAGRSGAAESLSLWNAVGDPKATYGALFGAEFLTTAIAAEADAVLTGKTPWGAEIAMKGAFYDQVATFDPMKEIAAYPGPLFVATGAKDTLVTPDVGQAYIGAHQGPKTLWAADMDHVFNIFADVATLDAMLGETIAFLKSHAE